MRKGFSCRAGPERKYVTPKKESMKKKFALVFLSLAMSVALSAQRVAVKTNLLYDATATVNAGIEIGLAPRWSLDVSGNYNNWMMNGEGMRWKHMMVQPELRYWFCDWFAGHFVGVHAIGGSYNFGLIPNNIHNFLGSDFSRLTDNRYQGYAWGGGIAYGYSWILGRHWNLEAEVGLGVIYTKFDELDCSICEHTVRSDVPHLYKGPTKLALNLVYVF